MQKKLDKLFASFASKIAQVAGSPYAFAAALSFVIGWAAFGPAAGFSENWQLIVNTGTTICTFLMVFVIQNSQNRDGLALQIKLDELIRALGAAKNDMIDLESLSVTELKEVQERFAKLGSNARKHDSKASLIIAKPRRENGRKSSNSPN